MLNRFISKNNSSIESNVDFNCPKVLALYLTLGAMFCILVVVDNLIFQKFISINLGYFGGFLGQEALELSVGVFYFHWVF